MRDATCQRAARFRCAVLTGLILGAPVAAQDGALRDALELGLDPIFSDGFEAGECAAWSASSNPKGAPDDDFDTFGDLNQATTFCQLPGGMVPDATDCNDADDSIHPGALELCDLLDNDCDAEAGDDGEGEPWLGEPCDGGGDSDLCAEGFRQCVNGAPFCDDETDSTTDLCNNQDDDCDPGSSDGSEDPLFGVSCDSPADTDLCASGTNACTGGGIVCSDDAASTVDVCDGKDNDCDPASGDGSEDPLLGASCDSQVDTDFCATGTFSCGGGGLLCSDDGASTVEACAGNGVDEDCDGQTDEGFPRNGNPACLDGTYVLGSVSGDTGSGVLNDSWYGESWDSFTLSEDDNGDIYLSATIDLYSPPGVDFDLYLYCFACGGASVTSSTVHGLTGHHDIVHTRANDDPFGESDTHVVIVEVRHVDSTLCAFWSLTVTGNTSVANQTCNP